MSEEILSESLEDYLEVILELEENNKVARAKDIADKMGIQRGSVTGILKILEEKKLINYEPYSYITLTQKGVEVAQEITRRHLILRDFLVRFLKLEHEKAELIACRMEHAFDTDSIDSFIKFIKFIDSCPRTGSDWLRSYTEQCSLKTPQPQKCSKCIKSIA